MAELEQNLSNGPNNFAELKEMLESGAGEIAADDIRRLAEAEEITDNLKALVRFAADLIEERDEWGVDTLTGLMAESRLNRALEGAFAWSEKTGEVISIVLYDLDKLKAANSAGEGHKGGDKLIQAFAQNLSDVYNPQEGEFRTGIIGRWRRGDEFLVAVKENKEAASGLDQKLQARLKEQKIKINGQDFRVSATGSVCQLKADQNLEEQLAETSRKLLAKKDAKRKRK
ncbi:MAG: hypothetical protein CEN92_9 [Candidatus Berkelbacteria bacterium Licking1014_96]|uniref:GGDEF domain-containing protein n=1 Tax=Candidatus Berkelbacteria bacterium Licking1014_96 TaxID=2017149 RepID=A0A554LHK6_9BACT|nr:MAG: hypothetical protein CEN92_9 [Candidatus Berkelbacteria bacterium Licking1014_96]